MRIELTFPPRTGETAALKAGTGTSSVTSPMEQLIGNCRLEIGNCKLNYEVIILETVLERNFFLPQGGERRPLIKRFRLFGF